MARVRETEEEFDRLDFTIEDMKSSSLWIEQAKKFNYSKQMEGGNTVQKLIDDVKTKKTKKDYAKSEKELGKCNFNNYGNI